MAEGRGGPPRWKADLALASIALVWGTTFVAIKEALLHISTSYLMTLRFSIGAGCMLPMLAPVIRTEPHRLWRGLMTGAAAGAILWLGYLFQTIGLKFTSAGNSGFITGFYILLVPLISAATYRRWPHLLELGGIAIAGAGLLFLTIPAIDRSFSFNRGDMLTVFCAVSFAFHILLVGYFSQRERFEALAVGQIGAAALLSLGSLAFEPPTAQWSRSVIGAVVLTSVFGTGVAFAFQTWAQKYTTATHAALLFSLEPVFAFITAVLIGGEPLTGKAVFGGALILTGILVVELRPAHE